MLHYIERRRRDGKTTRDAIRCLKRYLARQVWNLLRAPAPEMALDHNINFLT